MLACLFKTYLECAWQCLLWNANSILALCGDKTRLDYVLSLNLPVVLVVETKLRADNVDLAKSCCTERGYKPYTVVRSRTPKAGTPGGGLLIAIREDILDSKFVDDYTYGDEDHVLVVDVTGKGSKNKLRVVLCYFQPKKKEHIRALMKHVVSHLLVSYPVVICGDFNLPKINWKENSATSPHAEEFLRLCKALSLHQLVTEVTTDYPPPKEKNKKSKENTLIDLVLTADLLNVSAHNFHQAAASFKSDHKMVSM